MWAIQDPDENEQELVGVIHSATLMRGADLAIKADTERLNPIVQMAMITPIRHNKLYQRNIYGAPECILKLKDLGNQTNGIETGDFISRWIVIIKNPLLNN